ncbi:Cbp1p NDAI_0F04640 [Naumovozyma dairenensis CBS 421]|uniref:Uncharacterized protein n=1 Tax=Naumovozyma dairenensis (strain ATCC 10597 / BCRC 20456 / CBS 421 / NBRC 0211 / NRRL Y-12639) TaxID=1071378 RepID=G0WDC1_NAUDC|nr:hypothetical protein NDAI_0F04640 [Naumovozyma dairenensis CBS 421]CCD25782.1 hypothetical protein NDAI_0F04640 [Naumovozyma dairenensis CBS 421]
MFCYVRCNSSNISKSWSTTSILRIATIKKSYLTSSQIYQSLKDKLTATIVNNEPLTPHIKKDFQKYWKLLPQQFSKQNNHDNETILNQIDMTTFMNFINKSKGISSTARGIYRREIIYLIKQNLTLVFQLIGLLSRQDESQATYLESSPSLSSPTDILHWCLNDSVRTADVVMAADLYLLFYKIYPHEKIYPTYQSRLINALSFDNPLYDHIHLIKYLELHKLWADKHLQYTPTPLQTSILSNKAISLRNSPSLSKTTLELLLDTHFLPNDQLRDDQIVIAYQLIDENYKLNNASGVFSNWLKIKDHYISITKHDPRIIYKIIKISTQNIIYRTICKEILWQLSPQYYCNNPLLLPAIIDYATEVNSLSLTKEIMNNINLHTKPENYQVVWFTKRCLSSLLKMHLKFNDSDGVDRVLRQINEKFGKHSQENYQAIISHLLQSQDIQNFAKAMNLVNKFPPETALLSYGTIINRLINWETKSNGNIDTNNSNANILNPMASINELLLKAHKYDPKHLNSLWNIIAALYFKRLLKLTFSVENQSKENDAINTTSLDIAKYIYVNCTQNSYPWSEIDSNPFSNPYPHKVKLKITNSNKFVILRNIAMTAIEQVRQDIFLWCCAELYKNGMSVKELKIHWNIMLKHSLRKIEFKDKKHVTDQLKSKEVKFIKHLLK